MYKGKKLVVAGCSHVYGSFQDQLLPQQAHNRSWVNKLSAKANFDRHVNLGNPGGSNQRSFRVIKEYVLKNLATIKDTVIMIGLTELARCELPSLDYAHINPDRSFNDNRYYMNLLGPFDIGKDFKFKNFMETYYGVFNVDEHNIKMINLELISMHLFLKHFEVEHYFPSMLVPSTVLDTSPLELPIIIFEQWPAIDYAKRYGFKVGHELDSSFDCNHLDHDGNEFIADYILKEMSNVQ